MTTSLFEVTKQIVQEFDAGLTQEENTNSSLTTSIIGKRDKITFLPPIGKREGINKQLSALVDAYNYLINHDRCQNSDLLDEMLEAIDEIIASNKVRA